MVNRITKVYTRTGDKGMTGIGNNQRRAKDDPLIEAIGEIDELNCMMAVAATALDVPSDLKQLLTNIQHSLFDMGAEISVPEKQVFSEQDVSELEDIIDHYNSSLPDLEEFILPGGTSASAHCQLARAVCRRLERRMVTASKNYAVNPETIRYINRLSDLLFVLARVILRSQGQVEVYWKPREKKV